MAANESETVPVSGGSKKKSSNALVPIITVVFLVPALCYGVMEFLIIPKLKSASGGGADSSKTEGSGKAKKDSRGGVKPPGENMVEFGGIVVNLAGSGNSRFLRTTFTIASSEKDIAKFIEEKKDSLKDAAISVLSTQSLDVLDGANGREVVRKGIITRFNNVLGADMIDQIYFTEFLIQ
jgi:flagellar basal body-associated protein FliL